MLTAQSHDLEATQELAAALAEQLRPGDAVCLTGDLGAGKTTFVAALARALGSQDEVNSPTFTLENRYALDRDELRSMLHCDLYRVGEDAHRDLLPSMLEARERGAVLAVEWAGPVEAWLEPYLELSFEVLGPTSRRLQLRAVPAGWPRLPQLRDAWSARLEENRS